MMMLACRLRSTHPQAARTPTPARRAIDRPTTVPGTLLLDTGSARVDATRRAGRGQKDTLPMCGCLRWRVPLTPAAFAELGADFDVRRSIDAQAIASKLGPPTATLCSCARRPTDRPIDIDPLFTPNIIESHHDTHRGSLWIDRRAGVQSKASRVASEPIISVAGTRTTSEGAACGCAERSF